jgi:esterase/lipase superfamily enzyme
MRRSGPDRLPLLIPFVAACASVPTAVVPPSPDSGARAAYTATTIDTTWYITNRARRDGRLVRAAADSLEFGFVVSRFRQRVGPGTGGPFVEGMDADQIETKQLSRDDFTAALRARDSTGTAGAIMYVHGYAVTFGLAITQASDIGHRGSHRGAVVVFAWPAHASVVSWPSTSAVFTRAYRNDSAMAVASHPAFREAASIVRDATGGGNLTIVGHSLGSRLVSEALAEPSALRDSLVAKPLPSLVLFAPDIGLSRFRDTLAASLRPVAARRIVYASDDDRLMTISRLVNHEYRAGQATAARTLVPLGIELVDVTNGRRVNGALLRLVEPGHGMRYASAALYDFFSVVRGVPESCRPASGIAERAEDGTWRLSGGPVPAEATLVGCVK